MISLLIIAIFSIACSSTPTTNQLIDPEMKKYWYNGEAEITSYKLSQARYGEMREGTAVMVFVTEPFSKKTMSKADNPTSKDPSVLKLNFTKNFTTGIYPYSMMTSSFVPFDEGKHSLKISSSSQEWCGLTFMELTNSNKFNIETSSYFQGESGSISLAKEYLEDDIWSLIRLRPESLPSGAFKMIPSFFYLRLVHADTKAYDCTAENVDNQDGTSEYALYYHNIKRGLKIKYNTSFPHNIISWEETYMDGFGSDKKKLTTTGVAMKTIKSAYWTKNSNSDAGLRNELGLK